MAIVSFTKIIRPVELDYCWIRPCLEFVETHRYHTSIAVLGEGRVTDHRIGWSMYNLPVFMDGDIQECIDQLQIAENAERLKEAGEEG